MAQGISNYRLMVQLLMEQQKYGYNKLWVYYRFIDNVNDATLRDFEKMSKLLGYSLLWAGYKFNDWKKDKKLSSSNDANSKTSYLRDKRTSRF